MKGVLTMSKKLNSLESLTRSIAQKGMDGYKTLETFFGKDIDKEDAKEWFSYSGNYAEWSGTSIIFIEGNTEINIIPF